MPLGVDHTVMAQNLLSTNILVRKPLMPLGVDHYLCEQKETTKFTVRKPLMPLGVDHLMRLLI